MNRLCYIFVSLAVLVLMALSPAVAQASSRAGAQATVACGGKHTVAVKPDGTLWAWGANTYGQLGVGGAAQRTTPTRVGKATDWVLVACGKYHSLALKGDGSLWAWGANASGQLGLGANNTTARPLPFRVGTANDWVDVACGAEHTLALRSDGSLWTWGSNAAGQLGMRASDNAPHPVPMQVGTDRDWIAVAAGSSYSIALRSDGTLWAWGGNSSGELGLGDTKGRPLPVRVGSATDWVAVACGASHTLALQGNGSLWAWGRNTSGQLGLGDTVAHPQPTRVGTAVSWVSIGCGSAHSLATMADGSLWSWGSNTSGQLSLGTSDRFAHRTPSRIDRLLGLPGEWIAVAGGDLHSVAQTSDGALYSGGSNAQGQLGCWRILVATRFGRVDIITIVRSLFWGPLAAQLDSSFAIKRGELWTWGSGNPVPKRVDNTSNWVAVACGNDYTLALKGDGTLWAWGRNYHGQLGVGDTADKTTPTKVGKDSDWVRIACGSSHSLAVKSDGTLWAWGDNSSNKLGLGTDVGDKSAPVQVGSDQDWLAVAGGDTESMALKSNGLLYIWGWNPSGLGVGAFAGPNSGRYDADTPTPVTHSAGPAPKDAVKLGEDVRWRAIACGGDFFSLAGMGGGTLWACGRDFFGQVGLGTHYEQGDPVVEGGRHPLYTQVATDSDWLRIACGHSYALARKSNGSLWAWGRNDHGQLGQGNQSNDPYFGANDSDTPLLVDPLGGRWLEIACGPFHALASTVDGKLYAWGWNRSKQCGDAGAGDVLLPHLVMSL